MPVIRRDQAITVDTAAYAAGDKIGVGTTAAYRFDNLVAPQRPNGYVVRFALISDTVLTVPFDVVLYNADPSASTFTDNAAHAVASADQTKIVAVLHLNDVSDVGGASVHATQDIANPFELAQGRSSLWFTIIARAAATFGNAADARVAIWVDQDHV